MTIPSRNDFFTFTFFLRVLKHQLFDVRLRVLLSYYVFTWNEVSRENRLQDVIQFSELYQRLNSSKTSSILTKKWSIVYLLYTIGNDHRSIVNQPSSLMMNLPSRIRGIGETTATDVSSSSSSFSSSASSSSASATSSSLSSAHDQRNGAIDQQESNLKSAYQKFKTIENSMYQSIYLYAFGSNFSPFIT